MMKALAGLLLLTFAGTTLSHEVVIGFEPCDSTDMECLKKETIDYFEKSAQGIPELGMAPIDPAVISPFDIVFDENLGITFKLKNLQVTGLKNQKLHDFNLNKEIREVLLATTADLNIVCDIVMDYSKKSKSFEGSFTSPATVVGTYVYKLNSHKNDQGVDYLEVGPETFSYQYTTSPDFNWSPELKQTLEDDADWKTLIAQSHKELLDKTFAKIATETYKFQINQLKAAFKALPAAKFFKDFY